MICYKEKTNIIFRVRLSGKFVFYNQKDWFSSFYDINSQNWLVKFEGQDQDEFTETLQKYDVKIEHLSDNSSEKTAQSEKPDLPPQKPILNEVGKDDSQSDSSGSKQRANILNRMAKMGQAILPRHEVKNTSTELSDSDFDDRLHERRVHPRHIKKVGAEKLAKQVVADATSADNFAFSDKKTMNDKYNTAGSDNNNPQMFPSQMYNAQIVPSQYISNPQQMQVMPNQMYHPIWSNDGYNQYVIGQNTEIKMNMAQISAKLDSLLSNNKKLENEEIDQKSLMSRLKTLRLTIENLEISLQKSEESNSILRTKNEELQKKLQNVSVIESKNKEIEILENTVSELKLLLQENQAKSCETFSEIQSLKNEINNNEEIIEKQKCQLDEYEKLKLEKQNVEELTETIKDLNNTIDILKMKQKDFEGHFEKIESDKKVASQINNSKIKSFDEAVKTLMNDMYQSILDDFKDEESYNAYEIKKSVGKNLKTTTFQIIEKCVDIFREHKFLEE